MQNSSFLQNLMVGDKHTRAALHTYFPCTLYKVVLSGINSPSQCTRQHEAYFQNNGRGISYTGYKITEKRLQFVNPTQTIFFKKKWGALHTEFTHSLSKIMLRSIKSLSQ